MTRALPLTVPGTVMGTAKYMSPGKREDFRWMKEPTSGVRCVLYEMVAATAIFGRYVE